MSPVAGNVVRATDLTPVLYRQKSTTETVTSSTTLQNDDDIYWDLEVGVWKIELYAAAVPTTPDTADLKTAWTWSGTSSTSTKHCRGPATTTTSAVDDDQRSSVHNVTTTITYGVDGTVSSSIRETIFINVTAAGRLQWQWAQNSSIGTASGFTSATWCTCQKLVAP